MDSILAAGKGGTGLAKLMVAPVRKKRIVAMAGADGNRKTKPADIAEVFAAFYEDLYAVHEAQPQANFCDGGNKIPVTSDDVSTALKK